MLEALRGARLGMLSPLPLTSAGIPFTELFHRPYDLLLHEFVSQTVHTDVLKVCDEIYAAIDYTG